MVPNNSNFTIPTSRTSGWSLAARAVGEFGDDKKQFTEVRARKKRDRRGHPPRW